MRSQKIFFPSNLKTLRERKKMSQEDLAAILEIKRSKLAALESGQTKCRLPMTLSIFRILQDQHRQLTQDRLGPIRRIKIAGVGGGNDVYMTGSNLRVLAITVDKDK